ncbi:hypothetical protein [Gloeocapsa sp. PCC 7428]
MDKAKFEIDLKTQSAVRHQIAILGEAVKRFLHPLINSS